MANTEKTVTFLLADGDLNRIDQSAKALNDMGFSNILQAEDGPEAWSMFKNFEVDFVICNLDLPEVNGLALLKLIRCHEDFGSKPVILISSQVTTRLVTQAGRIGVSDILVWPCSQDVFARKIKLIIGEESEPANIEAEQKIKQGMELMKSGRFDEALTSFESVLEVHEQAEVYYNMGFIKSAKGLYEDALQCFRKATRINGDFARAYKGMADALIKLGREDEAQAYLEQAAGIYMERRQDQEAEEVYQTVTRLKPDTINVFNSLGIIYRRQGRYKEAAQQYLKALKVNPDDENIYYNLSRLYAEMKLMSKAVESCRNALRLNPDFTAARELLRVIEMGLDLKV